MPISKATVKKLFIFKCIFLWKMQPLHNGGNSNQIRVHIVSLGKKPAESNKYSFILRRIQELRVFGVFYSQGNCFLGRKSEKLKLLVFFPEWNHFHSILPTEIKWNIFLFHRISVVHNYMHFPTIFLHCALM